MKTFTLLTYSATALISALNISSVFAVPEANLPGDVDEYVHSLGQPRGDDSLKVNVPSYSWAWAFDDDEAEYEFPAAESESGSHARRAEPANVRDSKEPTYWVLAPANQQPPPPGAAFVPSPITQNTGRVYYRPFRSLLTRDGKRLYVLATTAETQANPAKIAWRPYQIASGTRTAKGLLETALLRPVPNSYALRDLARVRAQQEALATNSARTKSPYTTFRTAIRPYYTSRTAIRPSYTSGTAIRPYFTSRTAIGPYYTSRTAIGPYTTANTAIRPTATL